MRSSTWRTRTVVSSDSFSSRSSGEGVSELSNVTGSPVEPTQVVAEMVCIPEVGPFGSTSTS